MPEYTNTREEAFSALRQVIDDLTKRERKTLIQGVKPALQLHTTRQFDEQALGFATFSQFVDAAAEAGVIRDRREGRSRVLELADGSARRTVSRQRVRPDLWRAFTDWSGQRSYSWDVRRRAVLEVSGNDKRVDAENGLVPIPPPSEAEHVEWAKSFASSHAASRTAQALLLVLDQDPQQDIQPFVSFSTLIHADQQLEGEWKGVRRRAVADAIRAWAADHQLDVDPYTTDELMPVTREPDDSDATPQDAEERLRAAVKHAVDRMPLSELRELRLSVGALEGARL